MNNFLVTRRKFASGISLPVIAGTAGCSSADPSNSDGNTSSSGPEAPPEPTRGEVIEEFSDVYTVGTYEQPDEQGSVEDIQYRGRGSFPVLMPHTAEVEFEIDLTVQEGYDTIPLNVYFVDADNYLKLQENEEFEAIDKGTIEPVEEKESVSFIVPPGVYFMVFGSAVVGRESRFSIDYTSHEYLNYNTSCIESDINVGHLSLQFSDSLFNVESWNLRHHIQYAGTEDSEYMLELTLVSSDSEEEITQTKTQIEDCETNFVYSDEETLNVVNQGEKIIAEIVILDGSGEETLAETTQEVEKIVY